MKFITYYLWKFKGSDFKFLGYNIGASFKLSHLQQGTIVMSHEVASRLCITHKFISFEVQNL